MALATKVFSRGLSTSTVRMAAIKNITVIGGGLMGAGIAQVLLVMSLILHLAQCLTLAYCSLSTN